MDIYLLISSQMQGQKLYMCACTCASMYALHVHICTYVEMIRKSKNHSSKEIKENGMLDKQVKYISTSNQQNKVRPAKQIKQRARFAYY